MPGFIKYIIRFVSEVRGELSKCSWPWDPKEHGARKYRELIDSTTVVVIAMLLLSGYIAFWDFVMVKLVGWLVP
jgi:preprotein translocase subunit SecE